MGVVSPRSVAAALALAAWVTASPLAAAEPEIVLELDIDTSRLSAVDERSGERWQSVPVAVGSPAEPTPHGVFRLGQVILRPSWTPGERALAGGAQREEASLDTPMGIAKIPFAQAGAVALHGGGHPYLLGKPVSSGCVRAHDADLLRLIAWLHQRGALGPVSENAAGELRRDFVRRARIVVD